jgi:ParB family chromosome partitioning protein
MLSSSGKPLKRSGLLDTEKRANSDMAAMFDLPAPPPSGHEPAAAQVEPALPILAAETPPPAEATTTPAEPSVSDIPEPEPESPDVGYPAVLRSIPIDHIAPSPHQPRTFIDQEALFSLAESIEAVGGLIQPIKVRQLDNDRYELIAGERRLRACQLNGHKTILAVVANIDTLSAIHETAAENMGRVDLAPYEIALLIKALQEQAGEASKPGKIAATLGLPRRDLYRYQAYLRLPEDCQAILRRHPGLVLSRFVEDLVKLSNDGHGELVTQAVANAASGRISNSDLPGWINNKLKSSPSIVAAAPIFRDGKKVGEVRAKGNKLFLTTTTAEGAAEVKAAVTEAIRNAGYDLSW